MGRHRPASKDTPTATDLIARLTAPPAQATETPQVPQERLGDLARVDVTVTVSEEPTAHLEPPTTPIRRVEGRFMPPPPPRVRWAAGIAVATLAAGGLLHGDGVPVEVTVDDTGLQPAALPAALHAQPPTSEEVALSLAALATHRAEQERAAQDAQAVQAAADQAELDRRAEAERQRVAKERAEAEAARAAQEAREEAAEARAAQQVSEAAQDVTLTAGATSSGVSAIVPGGRKTSGFGARWGTTHYGVDIAAPLGTPIYSPVSGTVLKAGPATGFGNAIYIQDSSGDVWVFGHMSVMTVSTGDRVNVGDKIALIGNLGQSTGPHVHIERHLGGLNGTKVDPAPALGI